MENKQEVSEILINMLRHQFKKAAQEDLLEIARRLQNSAQEVHLQENFVINEYLGALSPRLG